MRSRPAKQSILSVSSGSLQQVIALPEARRKLHIAFVRGGIRVRELRQAIIMIRLHTPPTSRVARLGWISALQIVHARPRGNEFRPVGPLRRKQLGDPGKSEWRWLTFLRRSALVTDPDVPI